MSAAPVMKKLSMIVAAMAVGLAAYLWIELSRAQSLLRLDEQKTARLDALQASLASSRANLEALKQSRSRQAVLILHLQEERKALEKAAEHAPSQAEAKPGDPGPINLGKDSEVLGDGTLVYGPDAKIQLSNGFVVSSPSGVMVSDASRTHIDGDLLLDSPRGQFLVTNAFLTFEDGKMSYKADTITKVGPEPTR